MMNPKQEIKALESKDKKTKNRISIIQKNNNNDYLLGILSDIIDDSHEKEEISVLFLTRYKLEKYVN